MDRGQSLLKKLTFTMPSLIVHPSGWIPKRTSELGMLGGPLVELAMVGGLSGNDYVKILTWDTFGDTLMYIPADPREEYTRSQLDEMFGNDFLASDLLTLHYDLFWHNKVVTHRVSELRFFNGKTDCNLDLHQVGYKNFTEYIPLYCLTYNADTENAEYCYFTPCDT